MEFYHISIDLKENKHEQLNAFHENSKQYQTQFDSIYLFLHLFIRN